MECLNEALARSARILGDRVFIIAGAQTITFDAFNRMAARLANVFASCGVVRGTPVGLYLSSCPMLAVGYYACQKIGAIPVPMSAMYRDTEVKGILARTDMTVILTNTETAPLAGELIGAEASVLVTGGIPASPSRDFIDCEAAMAQAPDSFTDAQCMPSDPAALFFTSGTTGAPKGAIHTQLSQYSTLKDMMTFNRFRFGREIFLDTLPLFNNFGATCLMNLAVFSGATMIMHERWDTQNVLRTIREQSVTFIAGSPTMFLYLLREYDATRDDLTSLRLAVTGGAPVAPAIMEEFERVFGVRLVQIYGATEASGYCTGEPLIGVRRLGSAGVPFGSAGIAIVDDDGVPVKTGEIGEVRISGDTIGGGYWRDPDGTARVFTPEGWLSGDLGYVDSDGYLFIVDRKKDVIIAGGYNIYPLEVEEVMYGHAHVSVCALIGVIDEVKGEIPAAVIVPRPDSGLQPQDLIDYCRAHLAAYKAPRRVYFVDEMPLGPSGKILKRELRAWAASGRLEARALT